MLKYQGFKSTTDEDTIAILGWNPLRTKRARHYFANNYGRDLL